VTGKFSGSHIEVFVNNVRIAVEVITKADVKILKGPESHENGKFAWLMDPEGNKVELWEPPAGQ